METSALIRRALLRGTRSPAVAGQSAASRRRGEGYEFAELRAYVNGDDPRRIDWAATARVGALQSKMMLEEHALFLVSILDESASMQLGRQRSQIAVARDALFLWNQACHIGDRCMRVSEEEYFEARGASVLVAASACSQQAMQTQNIDLALRHADAKIPLGSSILVVSDAWLQIEEATLYRLATRFDMTILSCRDPWHSGFPLRGFVRLRDSETGSTKRFFFRADDERRYHEALAAHEAALRARFERAGWRFGFVADDAEEAMRNLFIQSII